jgi:hypothetical protein
MFAKKILVLGIVATALVTATGCSRANGVLSVEDTPEAQVQVVEGPLGNLQQSAPSRMQAQPSKVTCSGDQDNGGRICCDETHCCINIKGTINCKLPAPPKKTAR